MVAERTETHSRFGVKETDMDLIDLYHRRGIALVRSKLRSSAAARSGYARVAKHYAEQIEQSRADAPQGDLAGLTPAL
jgi:hypothetical protein